MSNIEALYSGIDWLTMTLPIEPDKTPNWVWKCNEALDKIVDDGHILRDRSMLGYRGYSAGNSFYGFRDDGYMAQFSGLYAGRFFPDVYVREAHVSRIDIQVTAKTRRYMPDVAKNTYSDAVIANDDLPANRRRKVTIIEGSDGGGTCYIGSPTSEQRARVYNKAVQSESPDYERCWRYEVTFKNELATRIASLLASDMQLIEQRCISIVRKWFSDRNIAPIWDAKDDGTVLPKPKILPTDVERKLKWLREQVRPSVKYLIEQGLEDTVRCAIFGIPLNEGNPLESED